MSQPKRDREPFSEQQLEVEEIQEILNTGTDLRQYSRQIEKQFKEVENKSIEDYIKESQNIAYLHNQIGDCDSILERMEQMLMNFQVKTILLGLPLFYCTPFCDRLNINTECSQQHKHRDNVTAKEIGIDVGAVEQSSIDSMSVVYIH